MSNFNFDEWASLYKNYPEEFERKRKEVLEQEIQKAPVSHRQNLRVLQMKCDAYHDNMSPYTALSEISKMMLNKLGELQDGWVDLEVASCEFDKEVDAIKKINNG